MNVMFKEFKEFALRGNVVDMAIGVIIGGAFGKIVSSVVADLMMPLIGLIIGKVDFKNLYWILSGPDGSFRTLEEAQAAGAVTLNYGAFISTVFDFSIIALCLFLFIKGVNQLKRQEAEAEEAPTTKECAFCCSEISINATRCPHCTSEV